MATTVGQPVSSDGGLISAEPTGPDRRAQVAGLSGLATVRKLVNEILAEPGTHHQTALTDDEWDYLCRSVGHESTGGEAVSRVLLAAYAMRDGRATLATDPPPTLHVDPVPADGHRPDAPVALPVEPDGLRKPLIDHLIPAGFASPPGERAETAELPPVVEAGATAAGALFECWLPVGGDDLSDFVPGGPRVPAPRRRSETALRSLRHPSDGRAPHSKSRALVMEERRRQSLLTVASWVRNIGAIILLFVAWQLWGTAIQQHHTQAALRSQFESKAQRVLAKPKPGFSLIPATTAMPDPPQGTVMAEIQIPKISLQQFVVSGTNESDLNKGPGHYLGTALPGQAGNVAIAGHRTTHGAPFNRLAELAVGDPIYLTAANGERLTYIVSAVPVAVSPRDVTVLNNFGDDRLTLTTCNPEYSAVQRLIVVAAFLPPGASQPPKLAKGTGKSYSLTPSVTSGWNTSLLPWLTLELVALVAMGLYFRRLSSVYGRSGRWLILGPVWLAVLLATFETLTNFLPAAV